MPTIGNRWRFAGAYVILAVLVVGIVAVTCYALLRNAPERHTLPPWWHGLSRAEVAVELESGRAPVKPDGAGALVLACYPNGPRLCVIRAVSGNHMYLLYFQVESDVWMLEHTEDLTAGSQVHTP